MKFRILLLSFKASWHLTLSFLSDRISFPSTYPDGTHLALLVSEIYSWLSSYPFAFCHLSCAPGLYRDNPTCAHGWPPIRCPLHKGFRSLNPSWHVFFCSQERLSQRMVMCVHTCRACVSLLCISLGVPNTVFVT